VWGSRITCSKSNLIGARDPRVYPYPPQEGYGGSRPEGHDPALLLANVRNRAEGTTLGSGRYWRITESLAPEYGQSGV